MPSVKKRVLVTGGAGFLGSHLCSRLLQEGCEVICVDNFFTGKKTNIIPLLKNPYFECVRHDVTFPLYVEVDEIYNLACPASPVYYQIDPVQTTKTSVHGAINMLGLAKRLKVKIFQASTSEIYGNPSVHPQTESYWGNVNTTGIRACYDEGKRCAETLFFDYYRQFRLPIKVARIFNTYGPNMQINDGRVISNFIVQALLAFEVKSKKRISSKDLKGLQAFKQDYPMAKCYVIHLGERREYHGDIIAIPLREALLELPKLLE